MKYAKFLLLAVGFIGICSISAPAYAVENSGVGGKPANPRPDNSRTESIFVHKLKPGETVRDAVRVINNTEQTKNVAVYATDAQVASGGAFACEQKADPVDREGSWVKLDKSTVELAPNGNEVVGFTITVPEKVAVGERNACIAIQAIEPTVESGTSGVQLSFRSAIRVAITVPGNFDKKLQFEGLSTIIGKDKLTVRENLYNGGNVSLDATLDTAVKSILGFTHERKSGDYPLLSGQSAEFNFDFKRPIWGGFYKIEASASYNSDGNASLGEKGGSTEKIKTSKIIFILPAVYLSVIYLAVLGGLAAYGILRYRKKRTLTLLKNKAISHTVTRGEDIIEIANHYHTDWKQLVSLNKLSAPYALTKDQELLVVPGESYAPEPSVVVDKNIKKQKNTKSSKTSSKSVKKAPIKTKRASKTSSDS